MSHANVDRGATDHVRLLLRWCLSLMTKHSLTRALVLTSTQDDQTALHYAAFYGHLEVVQFLVEHGVPLDVPDKVRTYAR